MFNIKLIILFSILFPIVYSLEHLLNNFRDYKFVTISLCFALLVPVFIYILRILWDSTKFKNAPPSPQALPIIGHMHLMAKYHENPWEGMDMMRIKYGDVVALKMGQMKCVLVSSVDAMKEVLLTKGDIFCDRPFFARHAYIFGGDKDNSLALCDWSELQKTRRALAQIGILPRYGSKQFKKLNFCIQKEIGKMMDKFSAKLDNPASCDGNNDGDSDGMTLTKNYINVSCSNIFLDLLCSTKFAIDDKEFQEVLYIYDFVFFDITQSYAIDFLPFLIHFGVSSTYLQKLKSSCIQLRKWFEAAIAKPRLEKIKSRESIKVLNMKENQDEIDQETADLDDKDFLDIMLEYFISHSSKMSWEACIYELADVIGGSPAVGNILMRVLGHLAVNESVQEDVYQEVKKALEKRASSDGSDRIDLDHRAYMPLTEACLLEALRIACSPIVPHVAAKDTTLQGFDIEKGTTVLFNSYHQNLSPKLWDEPLKFSPARFLSNNQWGEVQVTKPEHFFPFSAGRRSCLGFKMVSTITFAVVANLVSKYKLSPVCCMETTSEADNLVRKNKDISKQEHCAIGRKDIEDQLAPKGYLALSPDTCFKVALTPRTPI